MVMSHEERLEDDRRQHQQNVYELGKLTSPEKVQADIDAMLERGDNAGTIMNAIAFKLAHARMDAEDRIGGRAPACASDGGLQFGM